MAQYFILKQKPQLDKIWPVLRTALKECQDSVTINMNVCGDMKQLSWETIFIRSSPWGHTD